LLCGTEKVEQVFKRTTFGQSSLNNITGIAKQKASKTDISSWGLSGIQKARGKGVMQQVGKEEGDQHMHCCWS
jgi:hypothetical protein